MSRNDVRHQIAKFLLAGDIQDLNQVFTSFPARIQFQVNATAGQLSRAAAVVFIERELEERIALGGAHSGKKRMDYDIALQVYHHSVHNSSELAMDDFDATIDGIKDRLRSDHRFGDPNGEIIWQGAEPIISVEYGEPARTNGGATETFAAVRFQVTQILTA